MGAERPPYGARQRKFSPLSAHFSGRPVSSELPSRLGPLASGQSPSAIRRPACGAAGAFCAARRPCVTPATSKTRRARHVSSRFESTDVIEAFQNSVYMKGKECCSFLHSPLPSRQAVMLLRHARSSDYPLRGQVLKVEGLGKDYPTPQGSLRVLSGISLSLAPGEAAAIMGPSGSGKSTLLYVLGGLEPPSSGLVTLNGKNPFALPAKELASFRNQQVGFVFQDHCLLPQCSVLENVLVPTLVAESRNGSSNRARTLLEQVGLKERIDHRPGELSGGEQQRVALARALIREPLLLLCDEPTGNLDRASADTVASLLLDLHRSRQTILVLVTHNPELAAKFPLRLELIDRHLKTS